MAKALMIQGTGSDVGKSLLVAGLCRALANRGMAVVPFKPQNMSNNAAVAALEPDGGDRQGEIGRAQWLQAFAARRSPNVHMNPVLLKPQTDRSAQIIVQGLVSEAATASAYQSRRATLLDSVLDSFDRVARGADLVVVEGAGSPAEINLRAGDIANMGFARATGTPVVLAGDIDRGGVIAALVGTQAVLDPDDAALVKGFMINRFRGDPRLFDGGLAEIATRTGWTGFGVLPFLPEAGRLPAEDAVQLDKPNERSGSSRPVVAAPCLSRIANFDDLDPLRAEPGVDVRFVAPGEAIPPADLIVLLGTKATLADLRYLRQHGWDIDLRAHVRRGGHVLGLCGGYQMLGLRVDDPDGIEGPAGSEAGLGLLDIVTVMRPRKEVRTVAGCWTGDGSRVEGYEIHMGDSRGAALDRPFLTLAGTPHGAVSADGRVAGCYLHGLFTSDAFRKRYLARLGIEAQADGYWTGVDAALDAVAQAMETHLDIDGLLAVAEAGA